MSAPLRVAIAEDERDIRQFLVQVVRRMGHEVVCIAASGKELLECCASQPPDLVISDVRMPELNGDEAAEALRRRHPVPVVLISAQPCTLLQRDAAEAPLLILRKPISSQELACAVQQVLSAQTAAAAPISARQSGPG